MAEPHRHNFTVTDAVAVLSRTPATLDAMLRGLPDVWLSATEGPDTWSPYDIVGHLIHGDRADWITRARMILEHGESRAFEPFNRTAMFDESRGKSLDELLDTFAATRREALAHLAGMRVTEADLDRGGRHPHFGPVTLRQLLAAWVAHDLDHVMQISRVMARRYADDVGPWREYLRIVRDH